MDKKLKYLLILSLNIILLFPAFTGAKDTGQKKGKLSKTTDGTQRTIATFDINNLNALQSNVGYSDYNPNSNLEGTIYPKGTGRNAIFKSGFLWGAYVNGDTSQVYVGGSAYGTGLQPGPILSDGHPAPDANTDPRWSIYRVRPDVYPGGPDIDLSGDAAATSYWNPSLPVSADQVRQQYEDDWNNWPAAGTANDLGAPFKDVDGDGKYDPSIDIPGVPGADQTIFYVANDEDPTLGSGLYGSPPLGLEVHVTIWGYAQQGAFGNSYFKKYQLINKGYQKYTLDSMYVTWWADIDMGSSADDLVGNDTTLSLTYVYNGQSTDAVYQPLPPPAVGSDFFQGPLVNGVAGQDRNKNGVDDAVDYGIFNGKVVGPGKINLPMTAAYTFTNPGSGLDANYNDPDLYQLSGSTQFYNFMNGENRIGAQIINPITGNPSPFVFSGDPVTRTGWLDNTNFPPRDVRSGMASGPITMAPGDTQEVVVGEIVAGAVPGVSYLDAINLLKVYDVTAQNAYDVFFNLPSAPPVPRVQAIAGNNKVILDWGEDAAAWKATEQKVIPDEIDGGNYNFEGYNIYQLPSFGASLSESKLVATFDAINGVTTIPYTDPVTRTVEPSISIQNGSDAGVKRYFVDSIDVFNSNKPLVNGLPYYFAVTAYSYNSQGIPQSLENPISAITVTPHSPNPGVTPVDLGDFSSSQVEHSGLASATANVTLVNPAQTTGHQYQVTFHNEMYSLDQTGIWTDVTEAGKKLAKAKDLTGSSLSSVGQWSEPGGSIQIHYLVDVESPNADWCDAIKLELPVGMVIDTAYSPISNNDGSEIQVSIDRSTNTIIYGDPSFATSDTTTRDANGLFAGGEDLAIQAHSVSLPIITNYTMYDDNFGVLYVDSANGFPTGRLVDITSTDTLKTVANNIVVQNQWNVIDKATGNIVVKNQTVLGGVDKYAPQDFYAANGVYGPGGSSNSQTGQVGVGANPTFDGIRVAVDGSFDLPTTFYQNNIEINGKTVHYNSSGDPEYVSSDQRFDISDFNIFGDADATAHTTLPDYGGIGGTTSIDILQQDYELKWTGVTGDTTINGHTVVITKSGGSYATIFASRNYDLGNHPLNPNPGSEDPFLVRIPFEVWNTTTNQKINLLMVDRNYGATNDPTVDGFKVWNTDDRVYVWAVNTAYSATVLDPSGQTVADSATWNWVFFTSDFVTGDDIKFTYANPLQVGKDTFTFTTPTESYSEAIAKEDVSKINVFPNPYYGVNSQELSKYSRFVTFNHLPAQTPATIRIFNLAGFQVRSIEHTSQSQFETWDLNNESGLPVSSGIYIAYIDMPKLGQTKILKFAIIQEQQIPDHF